MCVFDGKTWTFGRMLGHSVSDLQLEQTLYALWIINLVSSSNTSFSQTLIEAWIVFFTTIVVNSVGDKKEIEIAGE